MKKIYLSLVATSISILSFGQIPAYQWAGTIGNAYSSYPNDCLADNNDNMYVVGGFDQNNADFDPSASNAFLSAGSTTQGFVAKYNSSGAYQWAFKIGNTGGSIVYNAALASNNDIVICGYYSGNNNDFDPGSGVYTLPNTIGADGFVARYTTNGAFVWAYALNGSNAQYFLDVAIDNAGNIYASSEFSNTVMPDPMSSVSFTSFGSENLLIVKLGGGGNYIRAWQAGGLNTLEGWGISTDNYGRVYVTGVMNNTCDFDPSNAVYNLTTSVSTFDVFVAAYDSTGNFEWAFNLGATSQGIGNSIKNDSNGNVYIGGNGEGTFDFDPSISNAILTADANGAGFLASYDSTGAYRWSFLLEDIGANQSAQTVAVDAANNVYVTGQFMGLVDFNPGSGIDTIRSQFNGGGTAVYTAKYSSAGNYLWAFPIAPSSADAKGFAVDVNNSGNVFVSGFLGGNADFDPTVSTSTVVMNSRNIYIARYGSGCLPPASPTVITGPITVCAGSSNFYQCNSVVGAASYIWTFPVGWSGNSSNDTISISAGTNSGVITVAAANVCGTSAATSISVTVNQLPIVSFTQIQDTVCDVGPVIALSQGSPIGGNYFGLGVIGTNFDPVSVGIGTYQVWYTYVDTNTGCEASDTSLMVVEICNSIPELAENSTSVFPNPFVNQVMIQTVDEGKKIGTVYGIDGRSICEFSFSGSTYELNTTSFVEGTYLLVLNQLDGVKRFLIIK